MHDGCMGAFGSGKQMVDKIRAMGFNEQYMPMPFTIHCSNCESDFTMETFESMCPNCRMVFGVTPCHAFDMANIMPAGIDY